MNNRKRVEEVLGPVDYCPMYNKSFVERHNVVAALLSDPDRRCSKARCHELFLVSDKDLEHLQCTFQRNVYHISKYPMHMYKLLEVANVAMKKFGGWDGLQAEMRKRDDKAVARHAKLEEKHARNRIARREELLPLLQERELEDYIDSCSWYLNLAKRNDDKAKAAVEAVDQWRFFSSESRRDPDWEFDVLFYKHPIFLWVKKHMATLDEDLESFLFTHSLKAKAREYQKYIALQEEEILLRSGEMFEAGYPEDYY